MIKPTSGHCNIDCRYCFYKKGHTCGGRMSYETVCMTLDRLSVFLRGGYPLVFQGGEPLLAGHGWFEKMFAYLTEKGLSPQVMIQTNGTLLDDAFAKLFAEHHVLVGVSLDGNEKTHSAYRSDFHAVMGGIECLRRNHCEFNILTVVTDELCRHLAEVYEFYRAQDFAFQQYIPCMAPPGADPYLYLSEESYGSFLIGLYDRWRRDFGEGRYVYVRYFENLFQILAGYQPEECGAGGVCSMQFLVESDGSVYPCDFYVEECLRLGNLCSDGLEIIEAQLLKTDFIQESRILPGECRACDFLRYCRGGCKRYRKKDGKYLYCSAVRRFFEHALPDMQKLLENSGFSASEA